VGPLDLFGQGVGVLDGERGWEPLREVERVGQIEHDLAVERRPDTRERRQGTLAVGGVDDEVGSFGQIGQWREWQVDALPVLLRGGGPGIPGAEHDIVPTSCEITTELACDSARADDCDPHPTSPFTDLCPAKGNLCLTT
jgi:hypothetical protein